MPESETKKWRILWLFLFLITSICMGQFAHAPLSVFIMQDLGLTKTQMGGLAMAVFIGGAVTTFLSGWLCDVLGVRRMIIIGVLPMLLSLLAVPWSQGYWQAMLLFVGIGVGFGAGSPLTNKGVYLWFPASQRAFAMGLKQSGAGVGVGVGALILPALALLHGWRSAYLLVGILLSLAILANYLYYRDPPAGPAAKGAGVADRGHGAPILGFEILICCCTGLTLGAAQNAFATFLTPYLKEGVGMPVVAAAGYLAASQVGGTLGRPVWGLLSDRAFHQNRKAAFALLTLIAGSQGLLLGCMPAGASPALILPVVFLLGGTCMAWNSLLFTLAIELTSPSRAGTVSGVITTANQSGMAVGPLVFGLLSDQLGYRPSFLVFGGGVLLWGLFLAWWPLEKRLARRRASLEQETGAVR